MDLLVGSVRDYDWGSSTAIAELQGRPPSGRPEAELWLGAHPTAPALVGADETPLDDLIAADPRAALGKDAADRFGGLPFLFKVLAADTNLSLQAHPSAAQAEAGFAREEAAGVARDAPERMFPDPHHKPELICALTRFEALCGFREVGATLDLLAGFAAPALDPMCARLAAGPPAEALATTLEWLLGLAAEDAVPLVDAIARSTEHEAPTRWRGEWAMVRRLAADHPHEPGVVTALLLNHLVLEPGEALFLGAGNLHAYLGGTAVELMANSDNVVRAGLTPKHVDVATLLDLVDTAPGAPEVLRPPLRDGVAVYDTPVPEFALWRIELDGVRPVPVTGPAIVLCVDGEAEVRTDAGTPAVRLDRGAAGWIPAADGTVTLRGTGTVFRAGLGADPPLH